MQDASDTQHGGWFCIAHPTSSYDSREELKLGELKLGELKLGELKLGGGYHSREESTLGAWGEGARLAASPGGRGGGRALKGAGGGSLLEDPLPSVSSTLTCEEEASDTPSSVDPRAPPPSPAHTQHSIPLTLPIHPTP